MTAIGLWQSATTAFLIGLTACLINIRFGTSKFCQMPIWMVWNIKTAYRWNLLSMPTVITLLPTLCDISILHAFASRCGGPDRVASSTSAWSRRALRNLCRRKLRGRRARSSAEWSLGGDVHGALQNLCTNLRTKLCKGSAWSFTWGFAQSSAQSSA